MWLNLLHGLTSLGNGPSIGYLILGALIGVVVGVIPGLTTAVVLSVILIFVFRLDLTATLCLFLGAMAGSYYSASVTAILLNTPAHAEAFPITLDGFPMARKGEPGRALGLSAASTCLGGVIGCAVLVVFLQFTNELPGLFHPPEYVALITLSMLLVGVLGTDSVRKAVIAAGAGLMTASIGPSALTGGLRYTFGEIGLIEGVSVVAVALGMFALPQMIMIFGTGTTFARQDMTGKEMELAQAIDISHGFWKQILGGMAETLRHWLVVIQGGLTGALTGLIPGIGGFAANYLSYGIAQQVSPRRKEFGTGIPQGIIAPEGASLAKEAGSMIPVLALGIPGSIGGALMLSALSIKNVRVGYGFTHAYPIVAYQIAWIIALSGILGTVVGVLLGPQLAKVMKVPGPLIVPFIFALCAIGPFLATQLFFTVITVVAFTFVGMAFRRLRYPLGSFILGFILGPTFETDTYLTHEIFPGWSFITARPFADVIFAVALGVLILKAVQLRQESRAARAEFAVELEAVGDERERAAMVSAQRRRKSPYPLLALMTSLGLAVFAVWFVVYAAVRFPTVTSILPMVSGSAVALFALAGLPWDVQRYVLHRRGKTAEKRARALGTVVVAGGGNGTAVGAFRERAWGWKGEYTREAAAIAWFAGLVVVSWAIGFLWGVPIFMVAYAMTSTHHVLSDLRHRVIFAALSGAVMWGFAYEAFKITQIIFRPKFNI